MYNSHVRRYNSHVRVYNSLVRKYNSHLRIYNSHVRIYNSHVRRYNSQYGHTDGHTHMDRTDFIGPSRFIAGDEIDILTL